MEGSLNFDTKLKTDEFKKQLKELKNDVSSLNKDLANLEKEHKVKLKFVQDNSSKYDELKAIYGNRSVDKISNQDDADFMKKYQSTASDLVRIEDEIAQTESQINNLNGSISNTEKELDSVSTKGEKSVSVFQRLKNGASALGKIAKTLGGYLAKASKGFLSMFTSSNRAHKGIASGLKNLLLYGIGIRSLYTLFSKLRSSASEGLEYIANVSPSLQNSMNTINGAFLQMKTAVGVALAPIVNALTPAIITLANAFVTATNAIANFFSALTGQKFVVQATKNTKAYAKSLGSASSESKKALASFDEINQLNNSSSGSGGGGSGLSGGTTEILPTNTDFYDWIKSMWDMADFSELGEVVASKIRDALNGIDWATIQDTARQLARSLATFINGFVETEGIGESIGHTLAQALNTAFYFLLDFVTTLNWKAVGQFIANAINQFFLELDVASFAQGLYGLVHGIFTTLITILQETDWSVIGQRIADFITNIDWSQLLWDVWTLVTSLLSAIAETISGITENEDIQSALVTLLGIIAGGAVVMEVVNLIKDTFSFSEVTSTTNTFATAVSGLFDKLLAGATIVGILWSLSKVIQSVSNLFTAFAQSGLSAHDVLILLIEVFGSILVFLGLLLAMVKLFTPEMLIVTATLAVLSLALEGIASVLEAFQGVLQSVADIFTAWGQASEQASTAFNSMCETLSTYATTLITKLPTLVSQIGNVRDAMTKLGTKIGEFVKSANTNLDTFELGFKETFNNVILYQQSFVVAINSSLDALKLGYKNAFNDILGYAQMFVNSMAMAMNNVVDCINACRIDIPEWVPEYGGTSYSPNLNHVSAISVPRLATGTVVPPNNGEFLAMLGDNKNDTEIVSPLETMKEAMTEALANQSNNIVIKFDGNLRQLARVLQPVIEEEKTRKGTSLVVGG